MTNVIEVEQLTRTFRYAARAGARTKTEITALNNVSMSVPQGEVVGLLGPNGAGKTTLIKILCTVLTPTSGSARVLGFDVVKDALRVRGHIGVVFGGERGLYGRLTVRDNLDYWCSMYGIPRKHRRTRIPHLLDMTGLTERAGTPVDRLSKGMKQRLHLARGLVNDPELIIMDEPTSGMDPVASRQFRVLIEELRHDDRAILLATHDMAEAEALCDRIALIDHGNLRGVENPKTIGRWLVRYERIEASGIGPQLLDRIRELPGVTEVEDIGEGWSRIHTGSEEAGPMIVRFLVDSGIYTVRTSLPSLEEVYLQLIGERGLKL